MSDRVVITRQDTGESLEIDCVTTADLGRQWAVTAHPRERLLPVTDQTTPLPSDFQISGIVSALDIDGAGLVGQQRFEAVDRWITDAAAALWTITVPGKIGITDALVSSERIGMDLDGKISLTVSVRHTAIVDAQTTARIVGGAGTGSSQGKIPSGKPSAQTAADLAEEEQDGTLPTGLLKAGVDFVFKKAG